MSAQVLHIRCPGTAATQLEVDKTIAAAKLSDLLTGLLTPEQRSLGMLSRAKMRLVGGGLSRTFDPTTTTVADALRSFREAPEVSVEVVVRVVGGTR